MDEAAHILPELVTPYGLNLTDIPPILLVTGEAGTGKTQLLRYIQASRNADECVALGPGFPAPDRWPHLTAELVPRHQDEFAHLIRLCIGDRYGAMDLFEPPNTEYTYPVIHLTGMDGFIPLSMAGSSVVRIFNIGIAMFALRNGLLLVDDTFNAFHRKVYYGLWQWLIAKSKERNVQIIASTFSVDCIFGYAMASDEPDDATALANLYWSESLPQYTYYNKGELIAATAGKMEF